jgi:hypothetical protein
MINSGTPLQDLQVMQQNWGVVAQNEDCVAHLTVAQEFMLQLEYCINTLEYSEDSTYKMLLTYHSLTKEYLPEFSLNYLEYNILNGIETFLYTILVP